MKKVIGITGSIGSGKSYAINIFKDLCRANKISASFIDVDAIRRKILDKENIDRKDLNSKIYNNIKEMEKYKEFINPKIRNYILNEINNNDGLIFIEWALLLEDNLYDLVDNIIMIYCKKDIQIKRLENGDLGKEEIIKRINLQLSNEQKIEKLKQLNKEFYIIDTSYNPGIEEYEKVFKNQTINTYPFCLFRIPENGGRVLWEITNTCNYKCSYCIFNSDSKRYKNELTTSEVMRAIKQLKENNFTYIKFTGGEPFTRKDMIEILQYAKQLNFDMDISTNASLITNKMAQELKDMNFPMVHVSLDGNDKYSHELVRGENTFERTINGIQLLTQNNMYTRIGTVIYKENENRLEDIIKLAIKLKANEIIFSFMEPIGRLKGDTTIVSKRTIASVKEELDTYSSKYRNEIKVKYSFTENRVENIEGYCPAVNKFLYINNLGQVSPCTWVEANNPEYKSKLTLKDSTFSEIIQSEPIQKYLNYIKTNNIKGCPVSRRKE